MEIKCVERYMVNPFEIGMREFSKIRFNHAEESEREENIRRLLCEAFCEVKRHPTYQRRIEIVIPEKVYSVQTGYEMEKMSQSMGGHIADWVELSLYWAQKIQEKGWNLCHEQDDNPFYRIVVWKNGKYRLIGGAKKTGDVSYKTHIGFFYYEKWDEFFNSVPLIAIPAE